MRLGHSVFVDSGAKSGYSKVLAQTSVCPPLLCIEVGRWNPGSSYPEVVRRLAFRGWTGCKRTLRALTRKAVVNRGMNGSIAERFGAGLIPMQNPVDGVLEGAETGAQRVMRAKVFE